MLRSLLQSLSWVATGSSTFDGDAEIDAALALLPTAEHQELARKQMAANRKMT